MGHPRFLSAVLACSRLTPWFSAAVRDAVLPTSHSSHAFDSSGPDSSCAEKLHAELHRSLHSSRRKSPVGEKSTDDHAQRAPVCPWDHKTIRSDPFRSPPRRRTDFLTLNHRRYRGTLSIEPAGPGRVDVIEQARTRRLSIWCAAPRSRRQTGPPKRSRRRPWFRGPTCLANMATDPASVLI